MENKNKNLTRTLVIVNLSLVALILYILSVFNAYPVFQQSWAVDPLAEIHALSWTYYLAVALAAVLIITGLIWGLKNISLYLWLLLLLAAMLWLTPYWLSGYVRLGDSSWHVGVAQQVPQVLAGQTTAFSGYASGYPGSFIYHFTWIEVLNVLPLTYIRFFPAASAFLFVLLGYVLLIRLLNPRAAVLALALAIPGLHFIQLHASPHLVGALLMFTALILVARSGWLAGGLAVISTAVIFFSHPTTPLLMVIFLAAGLITIMMRTHRISRTKLALAGLLVFTFAGWLFFYIHSQGGELFTAASLPPAQTGAASQTSGIIATPAPAAKPAESKFASLIKKIIPAQLNNARQYLAGNAFIYQNIYILNKGIYLAYAALAILATVYAVSLLYLKKRNFIKWLQTLGGLTDFEMILLISLPLLFILAILMGEGAHDLLETGLTYIILALSAIAASVVFRLPQLNRMIGPAVAAAAILFFTLSYPVVAYSIDAWSNFPNSEEEGLKFMANSTLLEGKSVSGDFLNQMALFHPGYSSKTRFNGLNLISAKPDVAVFRYTGYYYKAMRLELSFTDNSYTQSLAAIQGLKYGEVYASPSFQVFLK